MAESIKMNAEQLAKTKIEVQRVNQELKAKKLATQNKLDKDAFLRLLTEQLSKQDPLSPMQNTEFIAQMAQFTALEQMKNINTSMTEMKSDFSKIQVLSMINKRVSYMSKLAGKIGEGQVEKVLMRKDGALLRINGEDVPVSSLITVERNPQFPMGVASSLSIENKEKAADLRATSVQTQDLSKQQASQAQPQESTLDYNDVAANVFGKSNLNQLDIGRLQQAVEVK